MTSPLRRHIWNSIVALFVVLCAAHPAATFAAGGNQEPPRLMNLWFTWELPEARLAELAKWDIVVLDMDQQARYPDRMRRLKQLNPKLKILAYVDSSNIAAARFVEESHFPGFALAHAIPEQWYMHRNGARVSIWPGAWMLNVTSKSPTDHAGRRWQEYLPQFIADELWSTGLWDGIFLDNALDNATWFGGKSIDITHDGKSEADADVDREWKAGWQQLAKNLRARLGPNALIMGNGSVAHASVVNGILFEDFPRYGWTNGYRDYQNALRANALPPISAFNSNPNNVNDPGNWKLMRFTLASSLLGDGYYSFDYGNRDHGQTWWYDEYDAVLGKPTAAARIIQPEGATGIIEAVWWRDYERGAVVVNSKKTNATVELPGIYERMRGAQDPVTNSGRVEQSLTIPAQDGLILFRRSGASAAAIAKSTAFKNGDFVRVYNPDGTQARSGFFAQRDGVTGAATVLIQDMDQDGGQDVMVADRGEVRFTYSSGRTRTLRPFGSAYRGGITLAGGNTDRDDPWELIASRTDTSEIRVVEQDGTVRATWKPYPTFKGSISLAIGDLDGDGKREIITGPGAGGGPHIRIFKTDGATWGGSFFAFDPRERGGATVSAGDLDGDGRDELVVGSGKGSVPRIRIFNAKAELQREFALDASPSAIGVSAALSDLDGDGALELLTSGIAPAP